MTDHWPAPGATARLDDAAWPRPGGYPPERVPGTDDLLMGAITKVFLRDGFADMQHAELARRVDTTHSAVEDLCPDWSGLVELVVGEFLASAALRIDLRVAGVTGPRAKLIAFLDALSVELAVVGEQFYADLETCAPGLALYRMHTRQAAQRVQSLVGQGISAGELREVNSRFVGAILLSVLTSVQRGEMPATACLGHDRTCSLLTDILLGGIDA